MKKNNLKLFAQLLLIVTFTTTINSCKKETITIKNDPAITWQNPSDIIYGTELSETQLNARSNTEGTFVYTPQIGTMLDVGDAQNLIVNFTPNDSIEYNSISKTVKINVTKANPIITWAKPDYIKTNMPLGAGQLNATTNADGVFVYSPEAGTLLEIGTNQPLKVDFTPTNANRYNTASKTVLIDVVQAVTPAIWTSGTTGTLDGISFTITESNGNVGNSDYSTSDFSAGPLSDNQNDLTYSGYYNWTITFSSPVTNLKLYCKYWRTDTYSFNHSFNILSGAKLTANGNILSAVSYSDGIIEFSETISSLSVVSTQMCCSSQAMTIGL